MTTHQRLVAIVYPFKVIVSPLRAFKEIAQNPSIVGAVVLFALLLVTNAASLYASASKIILKIDGSPISLLASSMFSDFMLLSSIEMALAFFVTWFVYASILFLLMKILGEKSQRWLPFFILVGYVFSVFIIRTVVTTLLISTLPDLPLEISEWPPATPEDYTAYTNTFNAVWASTLASQVTTFVFLIVYGWFIALSAVAVHASREITWRKAMVISLVALLVNFTLSLFLPVRLVF